MDEGRPTAAPSDDEAADPRPAADWLLQRYVDSGDEAAFRELVVQHSDLVWGVCRRILRHQHDAEEAFQATLMVLAAKAGDVRRGRLGPWLYGVAYRVAVRAHQRRARRQMDALPQDVAAAANDSLHGVWEAHWRRALDDELNELPEKYREPLVLHYLQGMTNAQTAAALGVSLRAVEGRQRRGKALLKRRLARRNVTWTLAVSAAAAAEPAAAATIDAATRGALEFASSGTSESAGAESAGLAQEEVQAMTTSLLPASTGAAVLAALGAAILGAGGLAIAQSGDSRPLALAVQAAAADADLGELDAPLLAASATREERLAPNTFVAAAPSPDLGHYSEAEREIMQALEARTATLDFASAPLSEIMDLVSDEHGIQIWFDRLAMDNMAISPETEVTATLRNVRLKSALRLILSQVELTYVVRDDALVITTVDAAQVMFDTRVYDVAIIASQIQQDELTKLIVDTVASDSWAENGTGEGEVKPAGARLLVIKQTPEVHQQVTALLRQLNAALMKDEAR